MIFRMRKNFGDLPGASDPLEWYPANKTCKITHQMNNFLNQLPAPEELMEKHRPGTAVPEVNGHIHSPWSFCAFESFEQMFAMAAEEKIVALGINDFFTVDGYRDFEKRALQSKIFPLFNIEFMGLMQEFQKQDIRVNDPNNPGRVYFSGKALKHPLSVSQRNREFLEKLQENSQFQVKEMCEKTDVLLREIHAPFTLSYGDIRTKYAKNLVRERHIARAIREASYNHITSVAERLDFFKNLFGGRKIDAPFNNFSEVENEIRSHILKKGGRGFVPEDSDAFPDLQRIIDFILNAGGIPCYPVLLNDSSGNMTKFEGDWNRMDEILKSYNVSCLELIPQRNSLEKLEEFVNFFLQKRYVISFGTEHNTPGLFPITVKVAKDRDLPPELKEVSYKGTCVLAAHQYLEARGNEGFIKEDGRADLDNIAFYQDLGHAVITEFTGVKS